MIIDEHPDSARLIQEPEMQNDELQSLQLGTHDFLRLMQVLPVAIVRADDTGACHYANPKAGEIAGLPVEDLLGLRWLNHVHPDDLPKLQQARATLFTGDTIAPVEFRLRRPDGGQRWVLGNVVAEIDENGRTKGFILSISDTSDLKQREEQRLAQERAQRDTLIREVHHRIKNNLQSVGGLLRRELTTCLECRPRLEKVITQVHAVATVHGLQSARPGEDIRLCDTVRQVCNTVADLSHRPVDFCVDGEFSHFMPVHVAPDEAVALALVLNELVFNAVKHSPPGSPAPSVTLSADGRQAQVLIVNTVDSTSDPGCFDRSDADTAHNGLRLVRSLLPLQGADLTYEWHPGENQSGAGSVVRTRLRLSSPAVQAMFNDFLGGSR